MAVQVAMNRALIAHAHTTRLGSKCFNERERAAWADCLSLYEDTIFQLNRTLAGDKACTNFDQQTWLSAALTNLETCKAGFLELGVSDFVLPLMSNNVSKLITNSLALKKDASIEQQRATYEDGFPTWVSKHDRKLLAASTATSVNLVVAKDGSGTIRLFGRLLLLQQRGKEVGAVTGDGFIARGITFRNTAGPQNQQAVALRSGSDLSVFYQCSFEGYQDTLYAYSQRQFYRECNIYGTVDFIFGNAVVVFQNCDMFVRKPLASQKNTVTAQGRSDPNQNTGIYSRTVVMETYLDSLINSAGWLAWDGNFALTTLFYGEYKNSGPGSLMSGRVKWGGYKVITSPAEATKFSVATFIAEQSWLPSTSVPFIASI
ncbi:hypothetical protein Ancab_010264 [Ancistrocladus abbreviatus]